MLGDVLVDRGRDQLLHAEADLALAGIDGKNLRLDRLAFAEYFGWMVKSAVGDDLADVDHALNALGDLDEGAEGHELRHRALHLRADGKLAGHFGPWVGEGLLESEGNPAFLRLDVEDDGVNALAGLEDVGGDANFFAPGHFGDMNQAFDAGLQFHESSEIGDACDGARDALAGLVALGNGLPGLRLELLEAEGDFAGFGIDLEDLYLDLLARGKDVFGLGDAGPGDVGDVEQAVDTAEVDEGAVRCEVADGAGDDVAFAELGVTGLGGGERLLFQDSAAVDDDVFVGDVELGDEAGDLLADWGLDIGGVAGPAAAQRHEGAHANVHAESAFDCGGDSAGDGHLLGEGSFERRPVCGDGDPEPRELVVALFVAAGDGDREGVAGLDRCGVVREGGAGQDTFDLVADVENGLVGGE